MRFEPQIRKLTTLSFALDKETGKKCFTLPARELNIAWKNGPQHWQWITLPESGFWKVARLQGVCWLEIWGNMKTGIQSPKTTYAAYLIFEIMEKFSGLESIPVKEVKDPDWKSGLLVKGIELRPKAV
ncbi:hypothetical protein ACSBR1_031280 [Camellia fascicularis]